MIKISKSKIFESLPKIEVGLTKYLSIQESFKNTDVSTDRDFQRRFNHFYRVRRGVSWQRDFYRLMQDLRDQNNTSFFDVLQQLHKDTGKYEASFASKLVATIDENRVVIDKFVLENAGLKLPTPTTNNRVIKIVEVYEILGKQFQYFKKSEAGQFLIKEFERRYGKGLVSPTKMIDLVLWQTR